MKEIIRIAKAISVIQPNLDEPKYIEYALGIYKASMKYDIEPEVLISITQHETNFREDLPEGKAGELGICQIRKMWVKNAKFRREFRKAVVRDLFRPSKSFMFAAWILKDLKQNANSNTLPYWSFYNAVRFEPRFRYFLAVNKNLATLRRYDLISRPDDMRIEQVAAAPSQQPQWNAQRPMERGTPYPMMKVTYTPPQVSEPVKAKEAPRRTVAEEVATAKDGSPQRAARWISDALAKVQNQPRPAENEANKKRDLVRTAEELGVSSLYSQGAIQD